MITSISSRFSGGAIKIPTGLLKPSFGTSGAFGGGSSLNFVPSAAVNSSSNGLKDNLPPKARAIIEEINNSHNKGVENMSRDNILFEPLKNPEIFYNLVDEKDKHIIDEIIKNYPARITPRLKKLMQTSEAIQKQFLPSKEENNTRGTPTPFEEGNRCYLW